MSKLHQGAFARKLHTFITSTRPLWTYRRQRNKKKDKLWFRRARVGLKQKADTEEVWWLS